MDSKLGRSLGGLSFSLCPPFRPSFHLDRNNLSLTGYLLELVLFGSTSSLLGILANATPVSPGSLSHPRFCDVLEVTPTPSP